MEETNTDQQMSEDSTKESGKNWMLIIAVIILVLGGGYYFMTNGSKTASDSTSQTSDTQPVIDENEGEREVVDDDQTASDEQAAAEIQLVDVEGGMFYFKPNKIVVKKDVPVKITFKNVEGMHDFVIDELDIKSDKILAGKTTEIEFTPTKVGEFEFYCSVMDHKSRGMVGTLVVE